MYGIISSVSFIVLLLGSTSLSAMEEFSENEEDKPLFQKTYSKISKICSFPISKKPTTLAVQGETDSFYHNEQKNSSSTSFLTLSSSDVKKHLENYSRVEFSSLVKGSLNITLEDENDYKNFMLNLINSKTRSSHCFL